MVIMLADSCLLYLLIEQISSDIKIHSEMCLWQVDEIQAIFIFSLQKHLTFHHFLSLCAIILGSWFTACSDKVTSW